MWMMRVVAGMMLGIIMGDIWFLVKMIKNWGHGVRLRKTTEPRSGHVVRYDFPMNVGFGYSEVVEHQVIPQGFSKSVLHQISKYKGRRTLDDSMSVQGGERLGREQEQGKEEEKEGTVAGRDET